MPSAARYGGARPGTIGVGLYLAFPMFYTDVTDSYRLDRRGRLRTDLGGVHFNAIAVVAAGVAYFATGFKPAKLRCRFPSARFPGEINSRELAVADF